MLSHAATYEAQRDRRLRVNRLRGTRGQARFGMK
jgi:hypothetical protein